MSGKPCIHCGAHVNYFSGSNCDVGHLHRACWKAFHSTPKPETESPKHQQRPDEESGRTDAHDKESSNRGTSVSTHSEGGDATNIDEQTEPAFENTEAVAELLQAAVHALETEEDPERAKQLSADILDTYPDSKEAGSARKIIDQINADAVGAAKKAKQTKDTTYALGVGAAGCIRAIVGAVALIFTGFPIVLMGFVPPGPLIAIAVGLVVFVGILAFPFFGLIRSDDRKINRSDLAAPIAEEIPGTSSDLDQDLSHLSPFQRKHYRLQQNLAMSEKDNGDLDIESSD